MENNVTEEVRNQEDVESGYNDGESEEEQGEPQKHAELSGEHSEPSVHKGGETEGNEEPKEDHQEAKEEEAKHKQVLVDTEKDKLYDNFPEASGRESPKAPLATFDDDSDLDEFTDIVQETNL